MTGLECCFKFDLRFQRTPSLLVDPSGSESVLDKILGCEKSWLADECQTSYTRYTLSIISASGIVFRIHIFLLTLKRERTLTTEIDTTISVKYFVSSGQIKAWPVQIKTYPKRNGQAGCRSADSRRVVCVVDQTRFKNNNAADKIRSFPPLVDGPLPRENKRSRKTKNYNTSVRGVTEPSHRDVISVKDIVFKLLKAFQRFPTACHRTGRF